MKTKISLGKHTAPGSTGFSELSENGMCFLRRNRGIPVYVSSFLYSGSEISPGFVKVTKSLQKWLLCGLSEQRRVRISHISSPHGCFAGEHSLIHLCTREILNYATPHLCRNSVFLPCLDNLNEASRVKIQTEARLYSLLPLFFSEILKEASVRNSRAIYINISLQLAAAFARALDRSEIVIKVDQND